MRKENEPMCSDTLAILENGYYDVDGKRVKLQLTPEQMRESYFYLPEDIQEICNKKEFPDHSVALCHVKFGCYGLDSIFKAEMHTSNYYAFLSEERKPLLVLSFTDPFPPEEEERNGFSDSELFDKSSLLLSGKSEEADQFNRYTRALQSGSGSEAIWITPYVEIIKDAFGKLLPKSVVVTVMACTAPGINEPEGLELFSDRIIKMLKVAAYLGYKVLMVDLCGCVKSETDAQVVFDLFHRVINEFDYNGMKLNDFCCGIDCSFTDMSNGETEVWEALQNITDNEHYLDQIRGCMIGAAVGDALGYPVEFKSENDILSAYGTDGITEYDLTCGCTRFSDDTQRMLFAANGILAEETGTQMGTTDVIPRSYVSSALFDWKKTQDSDFDTVNGYKRNTKEGGTSWLLDIPELYVRRAPELTCLRALKGREACELPDDYIGNPVNRSYECGGILNAVPLALRYRAGQNYEASLEELDLEAAQIAAITHGHSLGYMPAAVLCHIINRILTSSSGMNLKEIVLDAKETVIRLFNGDNHLKELTDILDLAVRLSENDASDPDNIHALGSGYFAQETLAIAVYCALKYRNDFSQAIIASVNHGGASDSTGAVTGAILGALIGYEAIEEQWKEKLELKNVILEIADDLCHGCQMTGKSQYYDLCWRKKYMDMHTDTSPMPKYTFFSPNDEENGEFSTCYDSPMEIDGIVYFCVEQYVMARKAALFHDRDTLEKILHANTAEECRKLGEQVPMFNPDIWDRVSDGIVMEGNREKFLQNDVLLLLLWATGDSVLVNANPNDTVSGIGLGKEDAETTDPENWPGENRLGKILMELREELTDFDFEFEDEDLSEVRVTKADITDLIDVEAIVNSTNKHLRGGEQVNRAIHHAAGPKLSEACRKLKGCKTGQAKITDAYQLPCRYVIHTVGPVWSGGKNQEAKFLFECYWNSLQTAMEHGIRSIAFPSISTGTNGYPVEQAATIAVTAVLEFLDENPAAFDLVEWALADDYTMDVYTEVLNRVSNDRMIDSPDLYQIRNMRPDDHETD